MTHLSARMKCFKSVFFRRILLTVIAVLLVAHAIEFALLVARVSDTFLVSAAFVLPLAFAMAAACANYITDPLSDLAEKADCMAQGDLTVRADAGAPGEVGVLATTLNQLCDSLSQTICSLRNEKSQLNQILKSFSDGIAAIDENGHLTHYNAAVMQIFGSVTAGSPMELIPDESIWDTYRAVFRTREEQSMRYSLPGDRTLWISVVPVMGDDGSCTGVVGMFRDISEFERLEQTQRDYVANVSHELRTPITAMRGLLEPLADGLITDEQTRQRYYSIMLHESVRLSKLITDLLQLSRLQSGTEYMEVGAVDMEELLSGVLDNYRPEAEQKGIALSLDVPEDLPFAMTDEDRIEQILVILIDNAMHYTPEGGAITVSAETAEDAGERILIISVTDTGCGVSEQDAAHLFERFYKTDKSRKEGGTGLGLSIAKQIMDKLGGHIWVESEPGHGASFRFTLKCYVSNTIALGPSSTNVIFGSRVEEEPPHNALEDAHYEVLDQPKTKARKNVFRKKS